jgi:hypothetical protein
MSATDIQTTLATKAQEFTTHLLDDDKKHDLSARIHYHKAGPDGSTATIEKYHVFDPHHYDPRTAIIHDVRGSEADYTLKDNGFQYLKGKKPAAIDFSNDEQIKKEHYPAMEEFLQNA